ncbi:ribonuclease E inhibitor RraB [Pedobacter sp. AW1-32]|uniref:ribonuclease E inhibitor RraB n=1 Tax=Pedobacter sp. AW1-32 TaxID=3383026 RepID=UPI003FED6773
MMKNQVNTFFDKETYDNDIALEINEDVLNRIYDDGISQNDKLPVEFVFITDTKEKALKLKESLQSDYPDYTAIKIEETEDCWEIHGITSEIEMSINAINNWNQHLWDLGYQFDCQLDGWHVAT